MKKAVLTIAGSDCSGGAGIQADLKTFLANNTYGMSVITALTAQNTMGVKDIMEVEPEFLRTQLKVVFEDIFPEAVKIGMVSSKELIKIIAEELKRYKAKNIVLDPVMGSTSGSKLIVDDAVDVLIKELFPISSVITPNIPEAEALSGIEINSKEDMLKASKAIFEKYEIPVLCKGGHRIKNAEDLLYTKNKERWFFEKRIDNPNTHGTGCTLSSAIAANLSKGYDLERSIEKAKDYITKAIRSNMDFGKGRGPIDHGFIFEEIIDE
ncbi:MAG: bifunctional hydroxymethylpyrimidine kinase/phosphomethylpyrimidine kinase [Andreesenia angusta]|nr:bifunctional hydroxymethylpyrimidine kinase/phosphomethylpyrimidine kinase [Andreesenia angusta]